MNNRHSGLLQEWEIELPAREELIPVTQALIPPDLALAFKIAIDPAPSTNSEMQAASKNSLNAQCLHINSPLSSNLCSERFATAVQDNQTPTAFALVPDKDALPEGSLIDYGLLSKAMAVDSSLWNHGGNQQLDNMYVGYNYGCYKSDCMGVDHWKVAENGSNGGADSSSEGGSSKRVKKRLDAEFEDEEDSAATRTLKRPRLVWTPQLHKRFVEAVSQLGIKNAVPKMIMQLMNVDGLTRENVASHLQKYRLYLRRMEGFPSMATSGLDHLFASTPAPPGLMASPHFLSNHEEDRNMPFLMSAPMVGSLPLLNTELNMYNSLIRPVALNSSGNQGYLKGNPLKPCLPQNQILSLFPTNGA